MNLNERLVEYNKRPFDVEEIFESLDDPLIDERKLNILELNRIIVENYEDSISRWIKAKTEIENWAKNNNLNSTDFLIDVLILLEKFIEGYLINPNELKELRINAKSFEEKFIKEVGLLNHAIEILDLLDFFIIDTESMVQEILIDEEDIETAQYLMSKITIQGTDRTFYVGLKNLGNTLSERKIKKSRSIEFIADLIYNLEIVDEETGASLYDNFMRNINRVNPQEENKLKEILQKTLNTKN